MVNPLYLIIISLMAGFVLPLLDRVNRKLSLATFIGVLLANTVITGFWMHGFIQADLGTLSFSTAGFTAPLSINFQLGILEAFVLLAINLIGLLTGIYLLKKFNESPLAGMILFIMVVMGANGLILTRDLFNAFVFMEILSISTIAIITLKRTNESLSSGFKYMLASGIASIFFLLGVVFIYFFSGSLNLDFININFTDYRLIAVYMVAIALLIELKMFPVNGWALDVYESTDAGVATIISVINSTAIAFMFYKIMPLLPSNFLYIFGIIGALTYLMSNLMGLKQENARRLLGYSSIGQMGLLLASIIFTAGLEPVLRIMIVGGFFLNHLIAKTGLFWISGLIKKEKLKDWRVIRSNKSLMIMFGIFIFALSGFPPFAGFWAKWEFVKSLLAGQNILIIALILLGSLFEVIYMFRWFIQTVKGEYKEDELSIMPSGKVILTTLLGTLGFGLGILIMKNYYGFNFLFTLPILSLLFIYLIDFLPAKIKGIMSLGGLAYYGYYLYTLVQFENPIQILFGVIFLVGSGVNLISTLNRSEISKGFYGLLMMMIFSFGSLLIARSYLEFFLSWELMTIASFLLILRGKNAQKASLMYMIFSIAGAYLMMVGFGFAPELIGSSALITGLTYVQLPLISIILLALGFMIKSGVLGVHVWLPEAHAEAEADVSSFISAILLKAGIWGFLLVAISVVWNAPQFDVYYWMGWLGVFTALVGAFLASFQEDAKRLLAYSSMSQVGYIIAAISMLSHLGWVSAFYLSLNHMMFKSALFIAIAGVYYRTHTRNMYEMGGLIKKMPLSFISVLISIIAVSGVPPLSGFGSKWLMYSSFIERGWYLQAAVLFFASAVSFLYLYRLIHTIFLGQAKYEHKDVKEAPVWFIIPQYIFIGAIMVLSTFPNLLIKPLSAMASQYFNSNIVIDGYNVYSSYGHWNGNLIMLVTMGVFIVPLFFLILFIGKITKVKQFNIVYAAERPESPQTTHVAHNMYAHYRKALGGWGKPRIWDFWHGSAEWAHTMGDFFRRIYSGNGQTYLLHIILFFVVVFFLGV
ncbi:NADH-quinone oxidoreductase subunit F [bacterium]|nr:NADH-quinone oxidoreductase subunit F [bacterium]